MKKLILVILSVITAIALLPIKATANFAVADEDKITTGIFLPTSYLQYYRLDNPYAICRYTDEEDKEVVAISHKNEIVIYRDEKFVPIKLELGDNQVKTIDHYGNYLIFVFDLKLYSVDMSGFNDGGWKVEENLKKLDGKSASDISICANQIAVATESNISVHNVVVSDSGFSYDDEEVSKSPAEKPSNILFTDNAIYYSTSSGSIFKCGDGSYEVNAPGIRSLAQDGTGKIYYSCNNGIFTTDGEKIMTATGKAETEKDLGKIYDPKGICLTGKGLWVVDGTLNAVQEIDLTDNSFTKFAITTNSKAINRLSDKVKDISVDKDKIYALDEGRIVVINDIDGENSYNKIDVSADLFAVGDKKLLTYDMASNTLRLYAIGENTADTLETEEIESANKDNVKDLFYSDGKFYVLYEIYANSVISPVIKVFGSSEYSSLPKGYALQITADVFGNIYYATETQTGDEGYYDFYKVGNPTPIISIAKNKKLINLQTDLDGKLYALYEGNFVECYEESGNTFSKEIKLSSNLDSVNNATPLKAKSMCLSYNSPTAYFLFNGLILKSVVADEMDISTPSRITLGEDFSVKYDKENEFCKLNLGTNIFEADKDFAEGFKYLGIGKETEDTDYALFEINGKYSLVICEGKNYIVRSSDVISRKKATEKAEVGYSAVDFKIYSVPVTEINYALNGATKHEKIDILGEVDFNGITYYAINCENGKGYIPKSFILGSLAEEKTYESPRSAYLYDKEGVALYKGEDLSEVKTVLNEKTKVKVVGETENALIIDYNGEKCYALKTAEYFGGESNVKKAAAVILCALSLMAFALFFERKFIKVV